ncbi:MAG: hypothetical protein IPJ06_03445 [Saprospiraceae bacterium]|nr:hypothetical protein [Saprospiraceae bacterium]
MLNGVAPMSKSQSPPAQNQIRAGVPVTKPQNPASCHAEQPQEDGINNQVENKSHLSVCPARS